MEETTTQNGSGLSARKLAAQRRNAQKSTGPRTLEGTRASRGNAVKHGILATEILAHARVLGERVEDFKALYARFVADLAPRDALEAMIVDRIVQCYWRLRRIARSEVASALEGIIDTERDDGSDPDDRHHLAAQADKARRGMPQSDWIPVFGRYEVMQDRQLARLLSQLARLQARSLPGRDSPLTPGSVL